ncbi:hypothetical protein [Photobacterium kasasachensis]|uniref:hypothetical protein n=1 Tax=Photobacterium kasasachensis TaxID=2910240 RepID=UPI003D0A4284
MTEQTSIVALIKRVVKWPNALYALAPLFLLFSLSQPIIQDRDLSLSLTHVYPIWSLAFILLPACGAYLIGASLRWCRILLLAAIALIIALPFIDHFVGIDALQSATRLFQDDVYFLSKQTGYDYFRKLDRPEYFKEYVGLAWLTIPSLIACIIALVAPKYKVNNVGYPSASEFKQALSKQSIEQLASQSLSGLQATVEKGKSQLNQQLDSHGGVAEIAKDKTQKVTQLGQKILSDNQQIKDSLQLQTQQVTNTINSKSLPVNSKRMVFIVASVVTVVCASFVLFSSSSPRASEIEDQVELIVDEIDWKVNIHTLSLDNCEQKGAEDTYRCSVTADIELFDPSNRKKHIRSTMQNKPRTFVYQDGEWKITLDHVLSADAQFTLGMMAIGEALEGITGKERRW